MPFCPRLCLFLAAWVVLLGSSSNAEAPEAKFRQSLFRLDGAKLRQSMFLEATLRHKLPADYSCSSLEGSICLYSQGSQHPAGLEGVLLDSVADEQLKKLQKVKLVLLKPEEGESTEDFLTRMKAKQGGGAAQPTGDPLDGGHVMYEGNPSSLSDVETLANTMISALGLPQAGGTAEGLRRQLARALTDAEFAVSKQKQRKQAGEAAAVAAEEDGDDEPNLSDESDVEVSGANAEQAAGMKAEHTAGQRRRTSSKLATEADRKHEPGDADSSDAIKGVSVEKLAQSLQQLLASIKAMQHQQAGDPPGPAAGMAAQPAAAEPPPQPMAQPAAAEPEAEHGAEHMAGTETERVFVDEETGEEFVLPPDKEILAEGEEIFVDDRTGRTYVVNDEDDSSAGARRTGTLSRRLSDNMAWLDGLTDEEYEAYMDQYYDEIEREDQLREERQRHSDRQRHKKRQ